MTSTDNTALPISASRYVRVAPIFANERTAAQLLDMRPAQFLDLVKAGHLPQGREIAPGTVRWVVDDLRRIISGEGIEGMGDVSW